MILERETPTRKLINGEVDLCICPSESLISLWLSDTHKIKPIAVAAVLFDDTSAIVTTSQSTITNLSQLDNKKYASYQGRFEMNIVQQMIINSGGIGSVIEINPPKLDCFDAILRNDADSTWIFEGWEGLQAKRRGINLNSFPVSLSGVPYGHSPILLVHPKLINENENILKEFLAITARGYEFSQLNPNEAAKWYDVSQHESLIELGIDFVIEATEYLANGNHFLNPINNRWGFMDVENLISSRDNKMSN